MKKKIFSIFLVCLMILSFITPLSTVYARTESNTTTYTFSRSSSRSRSATITIPQLYRVKNITVDTGNVNYSINGEQLTINVSGGSPVSGSYTPSDSKTVTQGSGSYTWGHYLDGFNGVQYKSQSSQKPNTSPIYYNSGGYSGYLYYSEWSGTHPNSPIRVPDEPQELYGHWAGQLIYRYLNNYHWSGTVIRSAVDTRRYQYNVTIEYEVDTKAPTGTLTASPTSWTNGNVVISAHGTDSGSGMRRIRKPDGTYTNGATATYTVTSNGTYAFVFEDNVGNTRSESIVIDNIDKTIPSGSFNPNSRDWSNSNVTTVFTPSDVGSGIDRWKYRVETNGTWGGWTSWDYQGSSSMTLSDTGNYRIQAQVRDNAGNISEDITSGYYQIDKIDPIGTLTPSTTDWANANVVITAIGSDGHSGMRRIKKPDGTYTSGATATYTVTSNGTYTFVFEDNAGNTRSESIIIENIDKTIPDGIFDPDKKDWTNNNITVNFTPTDVGSGVDRWRYRVETNNSWGSWNAWNYTVSGDITLSENGSHRIQVEVKDKASNTITLTSGYYKIDKTIPNHISHSLNGARYTDGNDYWIRSNDIVKYKMRGHDTYSEIKYSGARLLDTGIDIRASHDWNGEPRNINYFQNGSLISFTDVSRTYNNDAYKEVEWSIQPNGEKDYQLQAYYIDNAGNQSDYTDTSMKLRIDDTAPDVRFILKRNIDTGDTHLTTNITDTRSGVKNIKFQISESAEKPTEWQAGNTSFDIDLQAPGTYYMHVKVTDNVDNAAYVRSNAIVLEDPLKVSSLIMTNIINPPDGTLAPIYYPVSVPPNIKAGYKMTFEAGIARADEVEVSVFVDGERITIFTDEGEKETIKIPTNRSDTSVEYTFWVDRNIEAGTILDMEIELKQGERTIKNDSIGKGFGIVAGSSLKDYYINLTN